MSKKKGVLGRGLSELLGDDDFMSKEEQFLTIDKLYANPKQPRQYFDTNLIQELATSIKANGILQPIIVRYKNGKYEIVAGERRWQAAQIAGLEKIPVIIKDLSDAEAFEISLIENINRENFNPIEEGEGYNRLLESYGYTQEQLSKRVGKSRSYIANMLRLLSLPEKVKDLVSSNKISVGHARAILMADNSSKIAEVIVKNKLSVRETENLVKKNARKKQINKDVNVLSIEENLSHEIGLNVKIHGKGEKGKIVIYYKTLSQFDYVVSKLNK